MNEGEEMQMRAANEGGDVANEAQTHHHHYTSPSLMRPRIAYMHNEPCATLVRHFCDDLGRFALKDDKGRQGTTHFATICDVSYHFTILYSAPFHFCDLF